MTQVRMEVTHRGATPKTIGRRQLNQWRKEGMRVFPTNWHAKFKNIHFTPTGARKYRYTPRRTKYIYSGEIKYYGGRARAPSGNPLVWSGTSQQIAENVNIKATRNRSSASYRTRVFNIRPYLNPEINMAAEFTTVLKSENRELARDAEQFVRRRISSYRRTIKVRIRT